MIKQAITAIALVAALCLNVTPVFAQGSLPSGRPSLHPRPSVSPRPSLPPNGEGIAQMCLQVRQRVDNRIERFEQNKEGFINHSQNLLDRITGLVERADNANLDTTQVKADLHTLGTKVNKLREDHQAFIEKLQAVKQIDCVQNTDQFRTALQDALGQFQVVKSDFRDIKDFFKNTIKPDVLALRNQLPHPSPTATP